MSRTLKPTEPSINIKVHQNLIEHKLVAKVFVWSSNVSTLRQFVLQCYLVKNMSPVCSADRCNSEKSDNAVNDLYLIGRDNSSERAHEPEQFGHSRYPIPLISGYIKSPGNYLF